MVFPATPSEAAVQAAIDAYYHAPVEPDVKFNMLRCALRAAYEVDFPNKEP